MFEFFGFIYLWSGTTVAEMDFGAVAADVKTRRTARGWTTKKGLAHTFSDNKLGTVSAKIRFEVLQVMQTNVEEIQTQISTVQTKCKLTFWTILLDVTKTNRN